MFEIKGKYNNAIIYIDNIDPNAIAQIKTLCNQEFVKGSKIRIMPDVHSGVGCTIGTTMTITDKVVPNLVGVDIGCGMEVVKLQNRHIELLRLDKLIYEKVPSGFNIRNKEHSFNDAIDLNNLKCKSEVNLVRARRSIGTLGGGNHFIEVNRDSGENLYIVIHSGSRHLGNEVAKLYQEEAYKALNKNTKHDIDAYIAELKAAGRQKEIKKELKRKKTEILTDIPKPLAYVSGELFNDYIHDMKIVQRYAELNRKAILQEISKGLKVNVIEQFTTIHNYIDTENMILRKGAVSAQRDEKLLIPINMRDGSLICLGKGNADWNFSAPHGAGRIMSRTQARHSFTLKQYKTLMDGIFTTSVNKDTIDECPLAYKTISDIVNNTADTVDIIEIIKPIYNFKAAD
ncbi:RNA-splicing ligase RtcB, repairs tRNA damage [Desulfotomaculum arcticum]|uniref:3'-phosphate/5'-hydroxy nucleic acid ligase n=1 Tax=Desulfotruncus arcticus DSM 17038 TaxID=1121424 RepID=A0A1I2SMR5_9FIRM|nr:RtcB family protein [Desulfotruncus arcticus]SFG54030.1 RNA-splicing ligase RtcB, repairs tRNA damage [Desulfotomaculum arcticum] [Desulfotruncus arcticus DSM 17038]